MNRALLVVSLLVITSLGAQAQKKKDTWDTKYKASEFRLNKSIRLKDSISWVNNLILRKKFEEVKWYSIFRDKELLEDIKLKRVRYGFVNGVLCQVYAEFEDSQRPLLETLFQNSFSRSDLVKGYITFYPHFSITREDYFDHYKVFYGNKENAIIQGNKIMFYGNLRCGEKKRK